MAARQIGTPEKIRKLQRTLYQQAKSRPEWRAWSLYGDLCRPDLLEEAMRRVLKKGGASGVDGFSVERMREVWDEFRDRLQSDLRAKTYRPSAIKRVLIDKPDGGRRALGVPTVRDRVVQTALVLLLEPVFEADFHDASYGYRPGKKAQEAVDAISRHLMRGRTVAIEADLSGYFDTIDHGRLLRLVKGRVSDGAILKLIKLFLRAPVEETCVKGGRRVLPSSGGRGVPQGGVVSPLLSNLYLTRLDHALNAVDPPRVGMVRYADDFVILAHPMKVGEIHGRTKAWLEKAGLTLNERKTRVTDVGEGGVIEFLGFRLDKRRSPRTGGGYIHVEPSAKARMRFRDKIREQLNHWTIWRDSEEAVGKVNEIARGWGNYFHHGNSTGKFMKENNWLTGRVRRWLSKKYGKRHGSFSDFPNALPYDRYGLYRLPCHAARNAR